jgi:hypothetical protein
MTKEKEAIPLQEYNKVEIRNPSRQQYLLDVVKHREGSPKVKFQPKPTKLQMKMD